MADQNVGGIALGLSLDTTGWSSGIARAKAELEGLKRSAQGIEVGVGTQARGGRAGAGTAVIAGGPSAVVSGQGGGPAVGMAVSPRFQVSAGAVRQLRVEINQQLRALGTTGEAVAVPIKLGRVPYATMRAEISAGIGEVPIRIKPDTGSLTAFAAVLSAMTGQTPGRARAAIESAAASRGIPKRAQGGPARAGQPHLVGENGPEIHWPATAGTYIAPKRDIGGGVKTGQAGQLQKYARELQEWTNNILRHAEKVSPSTAAGPARDWYQIAQAQVLGDLADFGRLRDRRFGLAAAAAASPGQPWPPNRGILRNVLRTGQAPLGTFREDVPGFGTQQVTSPYSNDPRIRAAEILRSRSLAPLSGPKTVPFFKNLSAEDLEAWVLDARQARIATNNVMKQAPKAGSWQRTILEAAHEAAYPQLREMWDTKHRSQAQAILWSGYGRGEDLGSDWGMTDSDILIPRHPGIRVPRIARRFGGRAAPLRPGETIPPPLGTTPLREGYVRGYHRTKGGREDLASIRQRGLRLSRAEGHTYGEPDAIWFAGGDPAKSYGDYTESYAVEAHLPARWFNRDRRMTDPWVIGGPTSNMAVGRDISARRIATYNEPWMRHYRYMMDAVEREGMSPGKVMRQYGPTLARLRNLNDKRRAQTPTMLPYGPETEGWDQFVADSWRNRKRYRGGPAFKDVFRADGGLVYGLVNKHALSANAHPAYRKFRSMRLTGFDEGHMNEMLDEFGQLAEAFPYTAGKTGVEALDDSNMQWLNGVSQKRIAEGRYAKQFAGLTRISNQAGGWSPPSMHLNYDMGPRDLVTAQSGSLVKTMRDLATHEFGHALDFAHDFLTDPFRSSSPVAGLSVPSKYAGNNPQEHFAELFLAHRRGVADLSQLFGPLQELDKQRYESARNWGHMARGGLAKAYRSTLEGGGGTFSPQGLPPFGRYAVGTAQGTAHLVDANDPRAFMRGFKELTAQSPYVGTWLHEGQIHIDPVTVRRHRGDAMRIARANEQLAIFDLKRMREIPVRRAWGGKVDDDVYPLEGFDDPIYGSAKPPTRSMYASFRRSAIQHLMGAGWSADEAADWVEAEVDQKKEGWRRRPQPPRRLVLSSRSPMADAGPFGRLREEMAAKTQWLESPEGRATIAERAARPDHSVDPITHRLPKGVKIRFSREWSDYPDPARFITTGGPGTHGPGWGNRWSDPGQLTMGFRGPDSGVSGGSPLGQLVAALGGGTGGLPGGSRPYFDPVGEVDLPNPRWGSLGEWLRKGMWGEGQPHDARSRAKLIAYALDQKNRVLGHAMVTATKAIPDYGPQKGVSIDAMHPEYVWTSPEARGMGLASAMYSRLEKITGMPIAPSTSQTPFGRRLWSKDASERSFGRAFIGRTLSGEDEFKIRERKLMPTGIDEAGWRAGSMLGAEPFRDFSNAVDPLDRPARPRRVRGQMRLPGFAGGGFLFKSGRPVDRDTVRAWETQLRETSYGPKELAGGRYLDIDPRKLPLKRFDMLDDIWGDRKREAGGSTADMGRYIVNEIGRELFVPKRLEHIIPPDVAEQIPGAGGIWDKAIAQGWVREQWDTDAWLDRMKAARNRAGGGGVFEIPGDGPTPWSPPEDGWIVPNRLMHRVPRHAGGSVHAHPGSGNRGPTYHDASGRFISAAEYQRQMFAFQQQFNANAQNVNTNAAGQAVPPPPPIPREVYAARRTIQSNDPILKSVSGFQPRPPIDEDTLREAAQARIYGSANRGLTGRAALGGLFGFLGGGRARREAAVEAQIATRQLQQTLPRGVSGIEPGEFFEQQLAEVETVFRSARSSLGQLRRAGVTTGPEFADLTKQMQLSGKQAQDLRGKLQEVGDLEERRTAALAKSQGGAAANLLSVTAAGFAFNVGMQALQVGLDGAKEVLSPIVDQFTAFTATGQRVSRGLAEELPQAGTLQTLMARRGVGAGLGAGQLGFLEQQLGGGVYAKTGGIAAEQAGELFRAALSQAPEGLIGGYGGLLGGGIGASMLGGGKGLLESLAGSFAVTRGGPSSAGIGGDFEQGLGVVGRAVGAVTGQNGLGEIFNPIVAYTQEMQEASGEFLEYVNDATQRGRRAQGLTGGGTTLGMGTAEEAARVLAIPGLDDYTRQLAENGAVFRDAQGNLLDSQLDITKAVGEIARGLSMPDEETFARTMGQALRGQREAAGVRGAFERDVAIPGQLGQQTLANPFIAATAGLAEGFEPTLVNLTEIQRLQDDITRDARASVEAQARLVDRTLGSGQGSAFRGYMADVEGYGQQIAALNEQLANRQARLGLLQYNFQLRVLNRQLADAKGLAGMAGGSRLGGIQREQWELSRESQRLQLESQRLANELAQRQINFQIAVAGFQAPGITGQERAARMEEARVEAEFAQRQLDIQKQQTAIGGQQYGLEGEAFRLQTSIAVQELEAQRGILLEQRALEQEQIAVQKQLAGLAVRQGQVQAKAQSLFSEATGQFDAELGAASQYVAQFGGVMSGAIYAVRRAIDVLSGRPRTGTGGKSPDERTNAMGFLGTVSGETKMIMGEAGVETVAILRNPRKGEIGAPSGGGSGSVNLSITVTGNTISSEMDLEDISRRLAREVEDILSRKASLVLS